MLCRGPSSFWSASTGRWPGGFRWAFVGGRYAGELPRADVGGAHWNSTVLSHAFYLAIEGGRNATTGRSVTGAGRQAAR